MILAKILMTWFRSFQELSLQSDNGIILDFLDRVDPTRGMLNPLHDANDDSSEDRQ